MRYKLFALLFCQLGLAVSTTVRADDYHLGQGLPAGDFILSGYANLVTDAPYGKAASVSLDDFSLFVTGNVNRWINPFTEVELSSLTLAQQDSGRRSNGVFILERFYNDVHLADSDTLRIGKILSPVGDWNLVHAAPLVPTITRPLTTFMGFSEYANGWSWLHENPMGNAPNWQLYWQPNHEWRERPFSITRRHYSNVWGGHINYPMGFTDKVGASFQQGQLMETGETYHVYGANLLKSFGNLTLQSEATTSTWTGLAPRAHNHESGLYALADYAFTPRWHGIMEWEKFQSHQEIPVSRNTLLGISYRPEPTLVWKLETVRQMGVSQDILSGWFASFSTLF